ncbi:hypothetical protein K466DRAFT_603962 [Polyporus arcularius HHB13444]|uniref:Homeobox domain-containing protein n=1 Tax=Polyporus arcularius HHB13444 TaxID=1314778 RepID=A0A5C3P8E7_9APHY|nr:hypothetical protein K466DRAFT_603962 [Polyporus arcularius HHB13444]
MNHPAPGSSWTVLPAASGSDSAGPSSSASAAAPSASSGATASAQQPRKPPRRLPPEAHKFLKDFYRTVTTNPRKPQRIELAQHVARISGFSDYTEANVNSYFANQRQSDRIKARKNAELATRRDGTISSAAILYPRLLKHPSIMPAVEACVRDFPDPTPEIAEMIAQRVGHGVKFIDIIDYAKCRRAQSATSPPPPSTSNPSAGSLGCDQHPPAPNVAHQRPPGVQIPFELPPFRRSAPLSQLPTPASSTSPEPRSQPTSPVVESSWGQAAVEDDEDEDIKDELYSDDEEAALRTEDSEQPPEVSLDNRLHDLAGTLQESLSRLAPEATRSAPPKSFAELAGWLSQQHTTSTAILQGISQGAYAPLGLSVLPSTPTPPK